MTYCVGVLPETGLVMASDSRTNAAPYFNTLREGWSEGLKRVFSELPDPDWY
jgi:predicted proteasome-type protease